MKEIKEIHCAEVGLFPTCDYVGRGETEDEVMAAAGRHVQDAHGLSEREITPEALEQVRSRIRDV